MQHVAYECPKDCDTPYCRYCQGGLFLCAACRCLEGGVPTDCPGAPIEYERMEAIYRGEIDYRNGAWVEAVSPHSPASIRAREVPRA